MSEWQPIETAPKDGTHILVTVICMGGFGISPSIGKQDWCDVAHWWTGFPPEEEAGFYGSTWCGDQIDPYRNLTHWMPIPQ